jgi:hypothetical protein
VAVVGDDEPLRLPSSDDEDSETEETEDCPLRKSAIEHLLSSSSGDEDVVPTSDSSSDVDEVDEAAIAKDGDLLEEEERLIVEEEEHLIVDEFNRLTVHDSAPSATPSDAASAPPMKETLASMLASWSGDQEPIGKKNNMRAKGWLGVVVRERERAVVRVLRAGV